jgi:hypothetical protein
MENINIKKLFKRKYTGNIIILMASIVLIYLLVSVYFADHFFFNTVINGADVSLNAHEDAGDIIRSYIKDYELQLIERNGETEEIAGNDIGLQYNEKNSIYKIYQRKNSFKWIISLLKKQKYYADDIFVYTKDNLENKINELNCLNKDIIEPQNVNFKYLNGSYEVIEEVYGNKIIKEKLHEAIVMSILNGQTKLDLNVKLCYENPKYTVSSDKTPEAKNLLNKYVRAKITYIFGSESEIIDGNIINEWLSVNENLEVVISEIAVMKYVRALSKKYDTVGVARNFRTSLGKTVEVKGGIYGWKINRDVEIKALLENIKHGEVLVKEPVYSQKTLYRDEDEIGNTYVEINITRQHLWFYKNGKLVTQGAVVTGNPNRGHSTVLGTYMLNYKQKGATLVGPDYEAPVTYWMPFFGNIGIHDASWRYSFGGKIYKRNGTHGCVNAPLYLAKTIFENIEDGTPIICYEE